MNYFVAMHITNAENKVRKNLTFRRALKAKGEPLEFIQQRLQWTTWFRTRANPCSNGI